MKKTTLISLLLVTLMAFTLILGACGSKKTIIGKWETVVSETVTTVFDFKEDKTLVMEASGMTLDGTYAVDGDKISLTTLGQTADGTFKFDGDKLVITIDGEAQTFTRVSD